MANYLIQSGSNFIYAWTPELAKMSNMTPCDLPTVPKGGPVKQTPIAPVIPESTSEVVTVSSVEKIISDLVPGEIPIESSDKPGMNAVRTELEAIDDPMEMVEHVHEKYGLKLTRTMKKSTMIERTISFIEES